MSPPSVPPPRPAHVRPPRAASAVGHESDRVDREQASRSRSWWLSLGDWRGVLARQEFELV